MSYLGNMQQVTSKSDLLLKTPAILCLKKIWEKMNSDELEKQKSGRLPVRRWSNSVQSLDWSCVCGCWMGVGVEVGCGWGGMDDSAWILFPSFLQKAIVSRQWVSSRQSIQWSCSNPLQAWKRDYHQLLWTLIREDLNFCMHWYSTKGWSNKNLLRNDNFQSELPHANVTFKVNQGHCNWYESVMVNGGLSCKVTGFSIIIH